MENQRDAAVSKLDKIYDAITYIKVDIGKLIVNQENIARRTEENEKRIDTVEKRPTQSWDALIIALISAGAAAAVTWLKIN
ncbi:MAG: hypothetical protein AB1Z23_03335 [Eubacteriales bacterium]